MAQVNDTATTTTQQNYGWDLAQPERINAQHQGGVNWSEASKFSDERLKTLQNVSQVLKQEEEGFIKRERSFLENSIKFLETFTKANQDFVAQEQANIRNIQDEIRAKRPDLERTTASTEEANGFINETRAKILRSTEEQKALATRRRELVDSLNISELSAIKFKDHIDASNDIFKWVLQVVYKENKTNYGWKNFKKQAFTTDKGKDFVERMKGLNTSKLRKDDFVFGKSVVDHRAEYLTDLEPKGKANTSLRNLLDYIAIIVEIGNLHEILEADNLQLEEQQKELEKRNAEATKITNHIDMLEEKVAASTYYIETLTKLRPAFQNCIGMTRERVEIQNNYLDSIRGNLEAIDVMAQSVQNKPVERRSYEPTIEQRESQRFETGKGNQDKFGEEENFSGEQHQTHTQSKKVESRQPVPATDLKESEFANSKKGSCESCGIF